MNSFVLTYTVLGFGRNVCYLPSSAVFFVPYIIVNIHIWFIIDSINRNKLWYLINLQLFCIQINHMSENIHA